MNNSLILAVLLAPIVFNIIALYFGFSILNLPQLHWTTSSNVAQYFNVRYGILTLPLIAIFIGLLGASIRKKIFLFLIFLVVIAQSFLIYSQGPITITEGTTGTNVVAYGDAGRVLAENVTVGQNILISNSLYSAVIFQSSLPIKDFITEGVSSQWNDALSTPENYADWIVMGNQDFNDTVYADVYETNPTQFLKNYKEVYCNPEICVYEKRTPAEMFIYAEGTELQINGVVYTINGVNDYDLAYKSKAQIDATFKNLNQIGVNTVRFWLFGDGNTNGFQTQSGVMNEARLENADYVIADAANYHIRLIPVLLNNWTDYGGIQQYLKWVGQDPNDQDAFYTDPEAISLFENYINHVVPRKNTITGISYNNDPTILAWEVVNEPRFSSNDTQAFVNWFSTIADYIRQKDSDHMITLETDTTSFGPQGQPIIQDLCGRLSVNFCTAHLYLYNNNMALYNNLSTVQSNEEQYIKLTNLDNKPFILGEVGVSKETSPFGMQPLTALKTILSYNNGDSGALIWNWSDVSDTAYAFSPFGTNGTYTLKDLSNVLGGIKPAALYLAPSNNNEAGYDVSTPETELNQTSTPLIIVIPAVTSSTIAGTSTTPIIITSATSSSNTSGGIPITPIQPPIEPTQPPSQSSATIVNAPLPYPGNNVSDADWGQGWGSSSVANGIVTDVGSNASSTSGAIFLDTSDAWTNYNFKADIQWVKGDLFTIVGRRTDDSDLIECVFSDINTSLIQDSINRVSDNQSVLMGQGEVFINNAAHIDESDIQVSMTVNGAVVQCSIDNATLTDNINNGLPPVLMSGGVGFETWDPQPGNSEIVVKDMSVTPIY